MHSIRQYLLTLCAASALCAVINTLFVSKKSIQRIIKLLTGMFMALCAFSPLLNIDDWDFEAFTDKFSVNASAVEAGESMAADATAEFIKEHIAAYVLDKAATMDLDIDAEVMLDDTHPPQVSGIIIKGAVSPYAKGVLAEFMNDTLGIAKEDQHWE